MPTFKVDRVAIEEWLGDTLEITLVFQQSDGSARDKSASSWLAQIRTSPEASSVWATMSSNTASAASGIVVFTLAKATTATATPGVPYYVDIQETTSASADFTQWAATITWRKDVSRS